MKKKIYFFLFFVNVLTANAQRNYSAFDVLDNNLIVPPNGILLEGNTFLDDSEVMNSNYLEYLHFLAQDSSEEALVRAYPDTTIFGIKHLTQLIKNRSNYYKKKGEKHVPIGLLHHEEKVREPVHKHHWWNYFSYHGTRHFPVVGISYEQALAYAKWRSQFITHLFNNVLKQKKKYKALQNQYVLFEFSLPDEKTWLEAVGTDSYDSTKTFHVSTSKLNPTNQPCLVFDHNPNSKGFYNLIGNVSEMTSEKGISKGGSFMNTLAECNPENRIQYTKPERWLGFRCVCKVTAKSNP